MKIGDKGPLDLGLPQVIKDGKPAASVKTKEEGGVQASEGATKVSISSEARQMQKVAALAQQGDELRADKVNRLKEQILQGEYHVEATELAGDLLRSEVLRLFSEE